MAIKVTAGQIDDWRMNDTIESWFVVFEYFCQKYLHRKMLNPGIYMQIDSPGSHAPERHLRHAPEAASVAAGAVVHVVSVSSVISCCLCL